MRRYELSDVEWSAIEPHLPNKVRGVARVDDRKVLNGILWRFRLDRPGPMFRNGMALLHLLQPVLAMAQSRGMGSAPCSRFQGL
jgi:hypothetical protein